MFTIIGLAVSIAGLVLIGFGIPAAASGAGGTLVIAGAIAGLGGLVLVVLAAILQQLSRLTHALEAWPLPRSVSTDAPAQSPAPVIPSSWLKPEAEEEAELVVSIGADGGAAPDQILAADGQKDSATMRGADASSASALRGNAGAGARTIGGPEMDAPAIDEAKAANILKAGVIEGMAYTLYVDGSIEAELPHGTVRFKTLDELRDHLARRGSS